jgi:hypothetical protein
MTLPVDHCRSAFPVEKFPGYQCPNGALHGGKDLGYLRKPCSVREGCPVEVLTIDENSEEEFLDIYNFVRSDEGTEFLRSGGETYGSSTITGLPVYASLNARKAVLFLRMSGMNLRLL